MLGDVVRDGKWNLKPKWASMCHGVSNITRRHPYQWHVHNLDATASLWNGSEDIIHRDVDSRSFGDPQARVLYDSPRFMPAREIA